MTDHPKWVNSFVETGVYTYSDAMTRIVPFVRAALNGVLVCAVSACLPLSTYHKEGVPVSRLNSDQTACDVKALRDAPVANQVRQTPDRYVPPRKFCDAEGNCRVRGGYWIEGTIYTVDVNKALRVRVTDQCMASKGYTPVEIPPCPSAVIQNTPPAATKVLPRLTPNSCAIRNKSGSWQIVTRG